MPVDTASLRRRLKEFDFNELFIEDLGWDRHRARPVSVEVNGSAHTLHALAEKRGMVVFGCDPDSDGKIPDHASRRKIERQIAKIAHEHIIIFTDAALTTQIWQWVKREPNRPVACREHPFHKSQTGEALAQKLQDIAFTLDEEETITIAQVGARARKAFDIDRVTKRFYDRFQKEHKAFLGFINGIQAQSDREWYASLMVNRLMFIYFIQRKGFLDGDHDYLRNRLLMMRERKGKDHFLSFYRHFLLRLFNEGLGSQTRNKELDTLLGKVPFLNGGLFDVHELERENADIHIPDDAFEKLFDFFDAYQWHLDERPLRADNEINPDVLGYIFEKYINQKQMGAYYTKEDITEYIAKNTIIPWLFDAAEKKCSIAFRPDSALWRLLRDDPDRYIYAAVRHGVIEDQGRIVPESDLPDFVRKGMHGPKERMFDKRYNLGQAPADDSRRLVTETWREYIARRERCLELRAKLVAGEFHAISDLITWNLDIRQFAQDAIDDCEGPELLRSFWVAIQRISILDPTCGSGAFLFAALNILEPLYEACLDRMQAFLDDAARSSKKRNNPKFTDFPNELERVAQHPNRRHFILKSIVIGNLYGVDIMDEAVEICKLRLFLKLVAQVEHVDDIEPLPDIDFNIRAGNTLVGFATHEEARQAISSEFDFGNTLQRIDTEAALADEEFRDFRRRQTDYRMDASVFRESKRKLRQHLDSLALELDSYLAGVYGVDPSKPKAFDKWRASHQPFHWFVEFYGIMSEGGFDAIIGNPPYVEYRKVANIYTVDRDQYQSQANNLYGLCMERASHLLSESGMFGMIVPAGLLGLDDSSGLRLLLLRTYLLQWFSTYSIRPSKLFDGVDQRLCIHLALARQDTHGSAPIIRTSRYHHWTAEERSRLFHSICYYPSFLYPDLDRIPQIGSDTAQSVFQTFLSLHSACIARYYGGTNSEALVHYHRSPRYWIRGMDFEQYFKSPTRQRSVHHFRDLHFTSVESSRFCGAAINSSLFFFWFLSLGNGRNITGPDVAQFPIGSIKAPLSQTIDVLFDRLMADYKANSFVRIRRDCEFQEFRPSKSKTIIDEIDCALAAHYGFTDEELDFIVNYEIKYRMGRDAEADVGD